MRHRCLFVVVIAVTAGLAMPPGASAGGVSSFDFDRRYYVPGDLARGRTTFDSTIDGSGRVEDGPFYAYLIPENGGYIDPPHIPNRARRLGPLRIVRSTIASIRFRVPSIAPGDYSISLCNLPCRESMVGDLWGGSITIVGSPERARLRLLADRFDLRLSRVERRLAARVRRLGKESTQRSARLEDGVEALQTRVVALEAGLVRLREDERNDLRSVTVWLSALVGLLLLAALVAVSRRLALRRGASFTRSSVPTGPSAPPRLRDGSPHPDLDLSQASKR